MKHTRLAIITGFIFLLTCWLILNKLHLYHSMWNSMFGICIATYSMAVGLHLAYVYATSENIIKLKTSIVSLCIGYAFFGLGTMAWFYIEYTTLSKIPFPSYADVFYIVQFPLIVFSLLLFERKNKVKAFLHSLIVSLSVLGVVLFLNLYFFGLSNIAEVFFLVYFPFESLFILVLSFLKFVRATELSLKTLLIGNFIWLMGDISFVQKYLNGTFYEGSIPDLFYFMGVFLVFLGLSIYVDKKNMLHLISSKSANSTKRNLLNLPASLNSHRIR